MLFFIPSYPFSSSAQISLQIATAKSCELVILQGNLKVTAGLWVLGQDGTCEDTQWEAEDSTLKGARAALVISIVSGFMGMFLMVVNWLLFELCFTRPIVECFLFFVAAVSGSCTFTFHRMDICNMIGGADTCSYNGGVMTMLIIAIVCYVVSGIMLFWYVNNVCLLNICIECHDAWRLKQ